MRAAWIASLLTVATLSGVATFQLARSGMAAPGADDSGTSDWHEIAWPFPRDGWPAGRAFRCGAAPCGKGAELYVRPKIGFCNCDSGVADDDEVDRVADLDMISDRFTPRAAGEVVHVSGMSGRARRYDLGMADGSTRRAVGFALSRRCDLMVAVVQVKAASDTVQRAAQDFLGSPDMTRWMTAALNGG